MFLAGTSSGKDPITTKSLHLIKSFSDWTSNDSENGLFYRIHDFIESFEEIFVKRCSEKQLWYCRFSHVPSRIFVPETQNLGENSANQLK